jgi:hypothetical protein
MIHPHQNGEIRDEQKHFGISLHGKFFFLSLAVLSQARGDGETSLPAAFLADFCAVTNSLSKAASAAQTFEMSWTHRQGEDVRLLFDVMSLLSSSKVEAICFKSSGFDGNNGNLFFGDNT